MGLSHGPPETTIKQWMDWRFHRHHPISPQADGLRSSHKIHGFFPSIPTVHGKKQVQNPRKSLKNPQDSLHFFQPKQKESVRLQAVALELQGADNDVEAITGSAGRRVPRVVEAPQEALQMQRQDAMRDAEKMATQAGYGGMGGFRLFFDFVFREKWWEMMNQRYRDLSSEIYTELLKGRFSLAHSFWRWWEEADMQRFGWIVPAP